MDWLMAVFIQFLHSATASDPVEFWLYVFAAIAGGAGIAGLLIALFQVIYSER